jgi:GNAT superfamily N-acetyltransferase
MELRKAILSDAEALSRLRADMIREEDNYSKAYLDMIYSNTKHYIENGLADRSYTAWVAEDSGNIIAMGGVTYYTLPPNDWCLSGKTAYIGNVYTLPAFRRQGIATRLLALLIDEAKDNLCQRILLNASDMGRPLYKKFGFSGSPTAMAMYPFGIIPEA